MLRVGAPSCTVGLAVVRGDGQMSGFAVLSLALPIFSAVTSRVASYVVLIAAARLLDPEEFGAFAVLISTMGIINAMVSGGGDLWLNRFTRAGPQKTSDAGFPGTPPRFGPLYLMLSGGVAGALLAIAAALAWSVPAPAGYRTAFSIATLGAIFMGLAEAGLAIVRAGGATTTFFALRDFAAPISVVAGVALLRPSSALGVLSINAAVWGAALAATAILLIPVIRRTPPISPHRRKRALHYLAVHTLVLIYGNFGSRLTSYIDVLILGIVASLTLTGEYRAAAQLATGFVVVQHFVALGTPWQLRRIGRAGGTGSGHAPVASRQRNLLLVSFLALIGFWIAAKPLLGLFDDRFQEMAMVLRLLLLARFADLLWGPQHEVLVSNGRVWADANVNVVALAVWGIVFGALFQIAALQALPAAVIATTLSSACGQGCRYRALAAAGLPSAFGHRWGAGLPLAAAALTVAGAIAFL